MITKLINEKIPQLIGRVEAAFESFETRIDDIMIARLMIQPENLFVNPLTSKELRTLKVVQSNIVTDVGQFFLDYRLKNSLLRAELKLDTASEHTLYKRIVDDIDYCQTNSDGENIDLGTINSQKFRWGLATAALAFRQEILQREKLLNTDNKLIICKILSLKPQKDSSQAAKYNLMIMKLANSQDEDEYIRTAKEYIISS